MINQYKGQAYIHPANALPLYVEVLPPGGETKQLIPIHRLPSGRGGEQ